MSRTPVEVPDELFARLRARFDEAQLAHVIALENLRGRFNLAFGIGAAGFSEGMVCAAPATTPPGEPRPAEPSLPADPRLGRPARSPHRHPDRAAGPAPAHQHRRYRE
jgi:hypothetical protein